MRIRRLFMVGAVLLAAACQTVQTTQPGAVGVDRKQHMLVSEQEIRKGADVAYDQELQKAKEKRALNTDQQEYQRVQNISRRLIPQTGVFRPDAPQWQWEVNVQATDDVNAYCMPGGKIMVYTGLIEKLKATDAELAAVIGHEIAHALARAFARAHFARVCRAACACRYCRRDRCRARPRCSSRARFLR